MGGYHHILRFVFQCVVDHVGIDARQRVGIIAALPRGLPFFCGTKISPYRVIKLQVTATGSVERVHGLAICLRGICEEFIQSGINLFADRDPATAEVENGGRRDSHLRYDIGYTMKKAEVVQHVMPVKTDSAGHCDGSRFRLYPVKLDAMLAFNQFHAVQTGKVIEMPPRTPEFPVGNGLQAGGFLARDHFTDTFIFGRFEGVCICFAVFIVGAGGFQPGRP